MGTITIERPDTVTEINTKSVFDEPKRVVLENNEWNSFDFIIEILMAYVPDMTSEEAEAHAMRIHETGRSVIYKGRMEDCREIVISINTAKERNPQTGEVKPPPVAYMD